MYKLVTFDSVLSASTNQKYSFGKGSRFPKVKTFGPQECGYNTESTRNNRTTNFGVGDRFRSSQSTFGCFHHPISSNLILSYCAIEEKSPSPQKYDIPSLFNPNNTTSTFSVHCKGTKKTYAFGAGRECFAKTVVNRDNVGPD